VPPLLLLLLLLLRLLPVVEAQNELTQRVLKQCGTREQFK
jgi:hypothetical protein